MSSFAAQQSLFRAYDIRGDEQYFTSDFLQALGEAFVRLYKNNQPNGPTLPHQIPSHSETLHLSVNHQTRANSNTVATVAKTPTVIIGYDVRRGSDKIAQTLAAILQQQGLQIINLGLITTPMMAFWTEQYDGHGIMVTASHSAKGTLGIKWLVNKTSPSAEDIQRLYRDLLTSGASKYNIDDTHCEHKRVHAISACQAATLSASPSPAVIALPTDAVAAPYIEAIAEVFTTLYPYQNPPASNKNSAKKLDLTVVIDCMHGATSRITPPLFSRFCERVIMINDTPDGSFPMGNPDPTEPNRLAELQQSVIAHRADIGLAFDGDGDRLMIVDNVGRVVAPDHLLYLLAQVAMTERSKTLINELSQPHVLFDIKCAHQLHPLLRQLGATPVMSQTGSGLMRQQIQSPDSQIIFAGELSGHFIFNDGYFSAFDDAMYAGLRLLHWLAYNAAADKEVLPSAYEFWRHKNQTAAPYQLTDIIQQLPELVSTADHYLPLPDQTTSDGSIVQQLGSFCHYLLDILSEAQCDHADSAANPNPSLPSTCGCSTTSYQAQHMTLDQAIQLLPLETRLSCIDGVRLDFAHSFGLLRQSNTSQHLTVRFAGDSPKDLQEAQSRFVALCALFNRGTAQQIAAIEPV